jgi:hypothetical protein
MSEVYEGEVYKGGERKKTWGLGSDKLGGT